ncbi:ImmA/IrrE family metallo-endopeptidase [Nocardia sp. NPDC004168]|uniref:ImmA/IrrE family metallo-endopeptidase n=1 Tax=Nocardia sp. NPDC004168 TaxID=3154452 RepID=UPI0033BEE00C
MLEVLDRDHPGAAAKLQVDPLGELRTWDDLSVSLVDEPPGSDGCSVAGSYQPTPPTLLVRKAKSDRRNGFTALHELGHHLQQTDLDLGNVTFTVQDSELLEEEACDAFAAQILLPDHKVAGLISERGPVAQNVVDVFDRFRASREACCVWAARHLKGAGAVILLDDTGTVVFAAPKSFYPPAKQSDQSATPLITAALSSSDGHATRDETYIQYRGGVRSDVLYGQAARIDDHYMVAIVVSDHAAWRALSLPRPGTHNTRTGRWRVCEICQEEFPITDQCPRCRQPQCADGHCGCHANAASRERRCTKCFLMLAPARFTGASTVCLDCAG